MQDGLEIPNVYDEIIENLFIGGAGAAKNQYGFLMVVNCTRNSDIPFPSQCNNCIRIDAEDTPEYHDKLWSLIDETNTLEKIHYALSKGDKVLVHCFAGAQRSWATVACYLIKYHGMSVNESIEYIRKKRPIAFHWNVNFIKAIELCYAIHNSEYM